MMRVGRLFGVFAAMAVGSWSLGAQASDRTPRRVPAVCDYDEGSVGGGGWHLAFEEDFGGDLARWTTWTTGAFNQELQLYQAGNVAVADGRLTLTARRDSARGRANPADSATRVFGYTSGRIETQQHFSASRATPVLRIAARIRLPRGYGMWPAFWTYGDPWPTQGEIDILEARGEDPTWLQTAYWYGKRGGINDVQHTEVPFRSGVDLAGCWHVYDVTWRRTSLTFRLDGRVLDVKRGPFVAAMFGKRQRVVLNLAVGGQFFRDLDPARIETGAMHVDWVRVYTRR